MQIALMKTMKEIVDSVEPNIRMHLVDYVYEEFEKRKKDFLIDIGFKWQLICDEIAASLYGKVLHATHNETTLTNNSKPDIIVDDGSIEREEAGNISYANFIIEVKKKSIEDADIYKYNPYCKKLSIWVLEGFDISEIETNTYRLLNQHLNTEEDWKIIDKLNLRKNQSEGLKHYLGTRDLKVEIVSSQTLISNLKNLMKGDLINRIKLLKNESGRIELSVINKIKNEVLQFSAKELKYVLKKSKPKDGKNDNIQNEGYSNVREIFERAINDYKIVTIKYSSKSKGITCRDINPYKIEGTFYRQTYILAFCHLTNSIRTFRLDKITECLLTSDLTPHHFLHSSLEYSFPIIF